MKCPRWVMGVPVVLVPARLGWSQEALSSAGKAWIAWLRTPWGMLACEEGERAFDALVKSIGPDGVDLEVEVTDPFSPERTRPRHQALFPPP